MNDDTQSRLASDELLGPEVQKILGLSKQRIHTLIQTGRLPARRLVDR